MQVIAINSWFDPQAATQAGTALIDNGADLLFGIMDEAGISASGREARRQGGDVEHRRPPLRAEVLRHLHRRRLQEVLCRAGRAAPGRKMAVPTQTILPLGKRHRSRRLGRNGARSVRKQADDVRDKMLGGFSPVRRRDQGRLGQGQDRRKARRWTTSHLYNWNWAVEGVTGSDLTDAAPISIETDRSAADKTAARRLRTPRRSCSLKGISKIFPGVVANKTSISKF